MDGLLTETADLGAIAISGPTQPMTTTTPTATDTPVATDTPTPTNTPTNTPVNTPTNTPTLIPTQTSTVTPTATSTLTPTLTLTPVGPAKPELAVIVLNRLCFGPREGDVAAFNALGADDTSRLTTWVDQQLNPTSVADADCDTRMAALALPTSGVSLTNLWRDYYRGNSNAKPYWRPAKDVRIATLTRAIYSKRQLFEMTVHFWHNHFNVYAWDGYAEGTFPQYDAVMRINAFGNFRTFLESVAKSPAMLFYLDNYINTVRGFNENWARELIELHTLGAENYGGVKQQNQIEKINVGGVDYPKYYVDIDVYEAARCFTGWQVDDDGANTVQTGGFKYVVADHDRAQKHVVGLDIPYDQTEQKDGKDVMDSLANHPGTAHFIAGKLCRWFIGDTPSEATIQAVADVFFANRGAADQIAKTMRTLILSPEFSNTYGEKIKRPFECTVGALRAVNADLTLKPNYKTGTDSKGVPYAYWEDQEELFYVYNNMGQGMFEKRSPDGWPDRRTAWNSTISMLMRWRFFNWMFDAGTSSRTWIKVDIITPTQTKVPTPTAPNIVAYWASRILGRPLPAAGAESLARFLAGGQGGATNWQTGTVNLANSTLQDRLYMVISAILGSPEFNWR